MTPISGYVCSDQRWFITLVNSTILGCPKQNSESFWAANSSCLQRLLEYKIPKLIQMKAPAEYESFRNFITGTWPLVSSVNIGFYVEQHKWEYTKRDWQYQNHGALALEWEPLLTGSLPDDLGSLPKLDRIQIDENKISGPIPTSFANCL
ncbi:hypothetical protein SLEP1_g51240 [Rubroshorea leprosula]|uniref:Uncharacterized protein n=1 Tax=Rubroshorea leprosula TaxID=152421 RepID=A0AAV5M2S3_9ROSI|nr:hypothetical protein SLEP1_g51240 [Rubroshorea leprosula]